MSANRAVVIRQFGDVSDPASGTVVVEERPDPVGDGSDEVVLDLLVADLQPLDRQIARGFLPGSGPLPMVAGVSAVGRTASGRTAVVLGEITGRGIHRDGLFADRIAVRPEQMQTAPPQLDPRVVAAGAVVGMHARHTLFELGGARAGERVLVLGATGGFGHAAMWTAHSEGLQVVAAARRPDHVDAPPGVPVLGLDDLAELAPAVRDLTGGAGVDLVVDPLGGAVTGAAVRAGARGCRHLLLGHTAGAEALVPVPAMMLTEHRIIGVNGFLIPVSDQHHYLRQALADIATGHHVPRIGRVLDLGEAAQAYAEPTDAGRVLLAGAALGDASAAVDLPARVTTPAPGRHDEHGHDHGPHGHRH